MAKGTQIGVFFDGTGRDMDRDIADDCESNVVKLFQLYDTSETSDFAHNAKFYQRGVGSHLGEYILGGMTGAGGEDRIDQMLADVTHHLNRPEVRNLSPKLIDVCGFSRGAAQARHFVNLINYEGIIDDQSGDKFTDVEIRFLAIFDTVASFGIPGNNLDPGFDFHIGQDSARQTLHIIAEHELRSTFDLMSIRPSAGATLPSNMREEVYPGAHSDIGGGYSYIAPREPRVLRRKNHRITIPGQPKKLNHLCRIPLKVMHDAMVQADVPLLSLEQHPEYQQRIAITPELQDFFDQNRSGLPFEDAIQTLYIHDSRYPMDTFVDDWSDTTGPRTIFYPPPNPQFWHDRQTAVIDD